MLDVELRAYKIDDKKSLNSDRQIFCQSVEFERIIGDKEKILEHCSFDEIMSYIQDKHYNKFKDYLLSCDDVIDEYIDNYYEVEVDTQIVKK